MSAKLREPFPPEAVGIKPEITCPLCKLGSCMEHRTAECAECGRTLTTAHVHLDYVGHAHVRERLLDVDPEWDWEYVGKTPEGLPLLQDGCLWIRLTVGGTTRLGVGDAPGLRGGRMWKELIGDAIRNAAMSFGVAIKLWQREARAVEPLTAIPTTAEATEDIEASAGQAGDEPASPGVPDKPAELRERIREITKLRGRSAAQTAADFTKWSKGQQMMRAGTALLAEYLDHLVQAGKR